MPEYAGICVNMPMFYISPFPICFSNPLLLEHGATYLNVNRRLEVIV